MNVQIAEFLSKTGLKEPLYPGKRFVQLCMAGPFKSHCIVYDWHQPEQLRIEITAGTTGHNLPLKDLQQYPISFQAPTRVVFEIANDIDAEEEDGKKGKSGSGSRKPKSKTSLKGFMSVAEGKVPQIGKVVEMVVMGKEIAAEAYGRVLDTLAHQISKLKISPTDLMAKAGDFVTKYTPPSFMTPKGDESATYKYDRERVEPMFGISS